MSLNKVMLIGNLGRDPEVRTLESGNKVASFKLATTEKYKDKSGERKEQTEWHSVSCWGKLADIVEQYVKKGNAVYVEGKIRTRSYEKDGETRYMTEILADSLQMLGGRREEPVADQPAAEQPARQDWKPRIEPASVADPQDDDLPF